MKNYNNLMEILEQALIGKKLRVSINEGSIDNVVYVSRLKNAWYEVSRINANSQAVDKVEKGNFNIRGNFIKTKRIEASALNTRSFVELLHLEFDYGKIELSGYGLEIDVKYSRNPKNKDKPGKYILSNDFDRGLTVRLREIEEND
jgi:hypothetical protein